LSYEITNEHGEGDQVASNLGWNEFSDWALSLPVSDYPEIHHLVQYGWERDLSDLQAQIRKAVKETKPKKDIASVAIGIVKHLVKHKSEIVMITNGSAPEASD